MQHRLYFLPLPHGHAWLAPTLVLRLGAVAGAARGCCEVAAPGTCRACSAVQMIRWRTTTDRSGGSSSRIGGGAWWSSPPSPPCR